jgi:lipoprotein-anchoring transpeptidase ErfK/SrfK
VQLEIPDDRLAAFVDTLAEDHEQAAADAELDWSSTGITITPERPGRTIARDTATADLRGALLGGDDRVELPLTEVAPDVTRAAFAHTLLVNQAQRRLYYYRDGALARQWSVAVGSGGHATPTGVFTVGAKRFEPTWTNPSPDGWGKDMPPSIPPGPDNPLGPRALNWNQNGRDTLIRFHGTPNEASIGQAASKGCVRMYAADVIELSDLVPSGATIVSVAG